MPSRSGKLYISPLRDPAENLNLERTLLKIGEPAVLIWRAVPAVVVGRNQDIGAEVNLEYAERHGIRVVRRITGGGAMYMDEGNLNICFITATRMPVMERCAEISAEVIRKLGIPAEFGKNDITVDGRKFSGWAETLSRNTSLAHGTIMFDVNLDALEQILTPPPEKYGKHGVGSVRQRVVNLADYLSMDMEKFTGYIHAAFEAAGFTPAEISSIPPSR